MRILFVTQVMLDQAGGASRHVVATVTALRKRGHEVTLIAPSAERLELPVRHVRPPEFLRPGARMELALSALVTKEVLLRRPDLAYVRISPSTSAIPGTLRALRIPIATELNGPVLRQLQTRNRNPGTVALARESLRFAVSCARATVAPSPFIARHAADELLADNVIIVPHGADLAVATPGDAASARERLELLPHYRVVTIVATLVPELRLDLLAEAHRRMPGVALLIVGGGEQEAFAHAMHQTARLSSPVIYLGRQAHKVAIDAIRAADVCVSVHDTDVALKNVEYAAVGRRQVTFEVEGTGRLVGFYPGHEAVFLVKERTPEALRAALERALEVEASAGPLPATAVERARKAMGWEHKARELEELFEEILEGA